MNKRKIISLILALTIVCSFLVIQINAANPYAVIIPDDIGPSLALQTGTYYIRNYEYDKAVQIDDDVTVSTSGASMELWDFDGDNNQRWQITHLEGDYYSIISVASGLALSVPAGYQYSSYAVLIQESYSELERQQWKITKTSRGTYVIRPRSGEDDPRGFDWCVAAIGGSNSSGTESTLKQCGYSDGTNHIDEWVFAPECSLIVNYFYDQGFSTRFNYINNNTQSIIFSYHSIVETRLKSIFGLSLIPIYNSYTSTADLCKIQSNGLVNQNNISNQCSHSSNHLTTTILRNDLNDGNSTSSIVIFTGHLMENNARSNSNSNRQSIVITPWLTSTFSNSDDVEEANIYDLIHELAHQIGAPDHYCYDENADPCENGDCDRHVHGLDRPRNCLMSYRYDISDLTNDNMFCSDCQTIIQNHLENHH